MRSRLSKAGPTAGVQPAAAILWAWQGAMQRPEGLAPIRVTQGPGRGRFAPFSARSPLCLGRREDSLCHVLCEPVS